MFLIHAEIDLEKSVINFPASESFSSDVITFKVDFDKTELRTEADVNDYVDALKKALLEQIKETRRISL